MLPTGTCLSCLPAVAFFCASLCWRPYAKLRRSAMYSQFLSLPWERRRNPFCPPLREMYVYATT